MAESNILQTKDNNKNKDRPELLVIDPSILTMIASSPTDIERIRITKDNNKNKDRPELLVLDPSLLTTIASAPTEIDRIRITQDNNKNKDRPELVVLDPAHLTTIASAPTESERIRITQENHESVVFIWFDPQKQSTLNLVGPLRAINDNVQPFIDSSFCFEAIKSSTDKIFFITSSSSSELITIVHNFAAVEAIFILDPTIKSIKGDFPKLCGIFNQQEELFLVLKEVMDIFEQIKLEGFAFEQDKVFLWSQIWKEKGISRKASSKKDIFVEATRQYYRDNAMIIRLIEELDKSYRPAEVISWCFRSPFPSRFLHHALRSCNKEQLSICRFLFSDAFRFFQQYPKRTTSDQFYRGMKLSNEILQRFEAYIGRLVCTSGFFPCTKSRTNALTIASLPTYRPDLSPVLFKIDCDASSLCIEIADKYPSPLIAFNLCTTFRIVHVDRGPMTVIKMKTASENGKQIALDYLEQRKDQPVRSLLDELLRSTIPLLPPKSPTPPPPSHKQPTSPPPPPKQPTPPPPSHKQPTSPPPPPPPPKQPTPPPPSHKQPTSPPPPPPPPKQPTPPPPSHKQPPSPPPPPPPPKQPTPPPPSHKQPTSPPPPPKQPTPPPPSHKQPTSPPPPPKQPTPSPPPSPKQPTSPPPPPPKQPTPPPAPRKPTSAVNQRRDSSLTAEETNAQKYAEREETDRALATYRNTQQVTARVLNAMGQLSADKEGDYSYAVQCHSQALKIQEESGDDYADTLTDLGNVYHNCNQYDLSLDCHTRALALRQSHHSPDYAAIASNFVGIANIHWAHQQYTEAIDNTQRALTLRENLVPPNEASVAATLAMLGNIYQDSGNTALAVDLCKRALVLFERTLSPDSPILAELFYNLGAMQISMELVDDACRSFQRAVRIYRKVLPEGHPDLIATENEYRRVGQLYQKSKNNSQKHS